MAISLTINGAQVALKKDLRKLLSKPKLTT